MSPNDKVEQYYYRHEQSGITYKRCFQPLIVGRALSVGEVQRYLDKWNSSTEGLAVYSMSPVPPVVEK